MSGRDSSQTDRFEIRLARIDDVAQLGEVEAAAGQLFLDVGMPEIATGETLAREQLEAGVDAELLWVAQASSAGIAGFALVVTLEAGPHLEELSVHPRYGRQGLGARLVEAVASELAIRGCRRLSLATFSHVPWNAPFYRKLGFSELAEDQYSPEIVALRRDEAAEGLALEQRVIMCRDLESPAD